MAPRAIRGPGVGEGMLARELADLAAARQHLTRAQELLAGLTEPEWAAASLVGLGSLAEAKNDPDSAEFLHRRAWQTALGHAAALDGLACVAPPAATRLGCSAQRLKIRAGPVLSPAPSGE